MDKDTLLGLEHLNELVLTDDQRKDVLAFFEQREKDMAVLNAIDTENVERMVWVNPMENILREDIAIKKFERDDLQAGCADVTDGFWEVPRVAN